MGTANAENLAGTPGHVERKDGRPAGELLPLVYEQLRQLARRRMALERADHTLSPTELVHEAYLRLVRDGAVNSMQRGYFFRAAAEAMRRILIEHARAHNGAKRGGGERWRRVPLGVLDLADEDQSLEILALDDAVERLEKVAAAAAEVVRLRFYAGLSVAETAHVMGLSQRSVEREWSCARAWLYRELGYDGQ
jgi:RNA polymerase sigma factor (TIGR02999 family)